MGVGLIDAVQPNPPSDLLDPIDDVVERAGQMADVLAVERGHKRAVQRAEDLVGDLVAGVLDVLEVPRLAVDVDERSSAGRCRTARLRGVVGAAVEQIEEAVVLGNQPETGKHNVNNQV